MGFAACIHVYTVEEKTFNSIRLSDFVQVYLTNKEKSQNENLNYQYEFDERWEGLTALGSILFISECFYLGCLNFGDISKDSNKI